MGYFTGRDRTGEAENVLEVKIITKCYQCEPDYEIKMD
jgi:hypothetical protein